MGYINRQEPVIGIYCSPLTFYTFFSNILSDNNTVDETQVIYAIMGYINRREPVIGIDYSPLIFNTFFSK